MDISLNSENSSKSPDSQRGKIGSLYKAFSDLNWDKEKNLSIEDVIYFLNINSQSGQFDPILLEKLLSFLGLDNSNSITVEDFINLYMQFDLDLQKSKEEFNNKLLIKQNSLNNIEEKCIKYRNEQLDSEGLCKNAKLAIEISDIDIKVDLSNLNIIKIIIEILYNNEKQELSFDVNQDNNENINKIFEFKPKSRMDNFIIVLKYLTDNNQIFEIGNKEFPVNEITMQEEYSAQIDIPEINNENNVGAVINAKILLYWSDYQYFIDKKNETEQKIEKIKKTINETNKYYKEINDIYLKNMKIQAQQNIEIQWNENIIRPNNNKEKSSYIDIDNNGLESKLNNDKNNQDFRNNIFDIYSNNDYRLNNNGKYFFLIKVLGSLLLGLGIIDGFYRNEFSNQLLGLLIFLSCYNLFGGNIEKNKFINKFNFYFCLAVLFLDIIWMFSNFNSKIDNKYNGGYNKFTKFIVAISIIVKGFCSVILFNKK